jgi:capsular polysaccharide transport system permease protein
MSIDLANGGSAGNRWLEAAQRLGRVVFALILREIRTRYGHTLIGYAWAPIEVVLHLVIMMAMFTALGRHGPLGMSLEMLILTGLIPYFMFQKVATRLVGALKANNALLQLPPVKNVDVFFARAILEFITMIAIALILHALIMMIGHGAMPRDIVTAFTAALMLALLGFGLGMTAGVLAQIIKSFDIVFRLCIMPLYLTSGVFFSVERLASPMRDILLYNPILHGVEWYRSAFVEGYGRFSLDIPYLVMWTSVLVIVGFASERVLRRKTFEA